jgi:hypothetical protein
LNLKKNYFDYGVENNLILDKLELLLRLSYLYDMGLNPTDESVKNHISYLERKTKENS